MVIFDVDSHFEPTENWLDEFSSLKTRLPARFPESDPRITIRSPEQYAFFTSHDVLRFVPPAERMPIERLVTPRMRAMYAPGARTFGFPDAEMGPPMKDPKRRIAWMDAQGVTAANLISGTGYTVMRCIEDPALQQDTLSALNTWITDRASDHRGRFFPVASLTYHDLDWAILELRRMRERGCRSFLFNAEPLGKLPPTDPSFDRLWAAACDLGMMVVVHTGAAAARFHPAWARVNDPMALRVIAVSQASQAVQVFLTAMLVCGVFERHPKLTVLIAEFGIDWIAPLASRIDGQVAADSPIGGYRLPLLPSEYVRRNVRVTPLPHPHQSPLPTLEALPEVAVYSSDMPHFESNPDPVGHYREHLARLPDAKREWFLGGNVLDCFARMGDPLDLATVR